MQKEPDCPFRVFYLIFILALVMVCDSAFLNGQNIFENHYGTSVYDAPFNFIEDSNGDLVLCGRTNSAQGACLLKTNMFGDSLWFRTYDIDTFPNTSSMFYRVLKTNAGYLAGGFYRSGNLNSNNLNDVYLVKTNFLGDTLYTHVYQTTGINDQALDMITDADGSIYFVIYDYSFPGSHVRLMKTDSSGNQLFIKDYTGYYFTTPLKIIQADSNNLLMLCESHATSMSGVDYYTPWLVKINSVGDTLWTRQYQVSRNGIDDWDVIYDNNKYYLLINPITGLDSLNIPNADVNLLTLDSMGGIISSWTYHWDDKSWPMSVFKTADGFLISGYGQMMQNSVLTKVDTAGVTKWICYRPSTWLNEVKVTNDGMITICGMTYRPGYSYDSAGDIYLSKADSNCTVGISEWPTAPEIITVYPNPFTARITVQLAQSNNQNSTVYVKNTLGQTVFSGQCMFNDAKQAFTIDLSNLDKGIYIIEVWSEAHKTSKKIVKY
ncbi:MAG TPA: T9SS type A sorting domain-containing protein [Bacteroidia bacterium]|nr:T9SS type A sorting domain-containing protein [Bacteroidia bacterium]